jgi:hypothetical protein
MTLHYAVSGTGMIASKGFTLSRSPFLLHVPLFFALATGIALHLYQEAVPLSHVGLVQPPGLNHTNVQKQGVEAPIPLFDSGGVVMA